MGRTIALEGLGLIWPEKESRLDEGRRERKHRFYSDAKDLGGEEEMPDYTVQQEAEAIDAFLARKWPAENELFEKLRPFLRQDLRHNYPSLFEALADLQQEAFLKLTQMRDDPKEVWRIKPRFKELAKYLMHAPARVMLRAKKSRGTTAALSDWHGNGPPNQLTSTYLKELMRLTTKLPEHLASALQLHAAHQMGDGQPLHEELGITQDAARRILVEAQDALFTLSHSEVDDD